MEYFSAGYLFNEAVFETFKVMQMKTLPRWHIKEEAFFYRFRELGFLVCYSLIQLDTLGGPDGLVRVRSYSCRLCYLLVNLASS